MSDLLAGLVPEKGLHRLVERPGPSVIDVQRTHDDEWYYTVRCPECGEWGDTYEPGTAAYVSGWHDMHHASEEFMHAPEWPVRGVSNHTDGGAK